MHKSVFELHGFTKYNIPQTAKDFGFLIQCVDLIRQVIYRYFTEEYSDIDDEINSSEIINSIEKFRDYGDEYSKLKQEVEKMMLKN